MKRMIRVLVAAAMLVSAMTCSAFAATPDYTEDKATDAAKYVGTVDYDAGSGKYTATYTGATPGNQYVLLVATGTPDSYQITQDGIQYIDQAEAKADGSGTVTFTFIPKSTTDSVVLLGGEFNGATSPVVLGALKVPYTVGDVTLDGFIDAMDAILLLQHCAGVLEEPLTSTQLLAGDVEKDGAVDMMDIVPVLYYCVYSTFPA